MKAYAVKLKDTGSPNENLSIELTSRCNSSCTHCFARAGQAEGMSLTLELAREVCVEGYAAGYRHLHLTGGEPLLWEGLSDLLDVVFSLGYRSVFLNTNGILITDRVARRLAQYPHL
ncbi:MAG: radical SAM protein, partial [Desulfobacterales bacterium]